MAVGEEATAAVSPALAVTRGGGGARLYKLHKFNHVRNEVAPCCSNACSMYASDFLADMKAAFGRSMNCMPPAANFFARAAAAGLSSEVAAVVTKAVAGAAAAATVLAA
jgi:hypothetical protein